MSIVKLIEIGKAVVPFVRDVHPEDHPDQFWEYLGDGAWFFYDHGFRSCPMTPVCSNCFRRRYSPESLECVNCEIM